MTGYLVFVTIEDTTPLLAIEGVRGFEGRTRCGGRGRCARRGGCPRPAAIRFAKKYAAETNPRPEGAGCRRRAS
ncbi:MAG: hypothetical protein R2789_01045 [Microthrixaceae bacterium]